MGETMKVLDVLKITNGKLLRNFKPDLEVGEFQIDSRKLEENDVFICLKGEHTDGHLFISEAISKKASCILVQEDVPKIKCKIPIIQVEDTKLALHQLAKYQKELYHPFTIAITGSVGKTTTKELISAILSRKYKVLKNSGSENGQLGLPLTLLKTKKDTEVLVTEMGMNHKGEIHKLSLLAKPDMAVITNIGTAHIGNLGSKKNIYHAKLEIVDGMPSGQIIVNGDDPFLRKNPKYKNLKWIRVGEGKYNDLYCTKVRPTLHGTSFYLFYQGKYYTVYFPVPGEHLISNVLLAIEVGLQMDVPIEQIIDTLSEFTMLKGRMEVFSYSNEVTLISDCYNASYESILGSIRLLKNFQNEKLLIVGDVLELGKYSKKYHKKIGKLLHLKNTKVLLVGKEFSILKNKFLHFLNNDLLWEYIIEHQLLHDNQTILVKGSRNMHLESIVQNIQSFYEIQQ